MNTGFGAGKEPKETQKSCVNWYDYGARMYDPALGRWHVIDALAEQLPNWTPYRYAFNNPVNIIDIGGYIEWPVKGNTAVNKQDTKNGGWSLKNTVVRTSTYMSTNRPPEASNPHVGIDYRAAVGTDFYSLGDGKITKMGTFKSGAKYVEVEYGNGDKVRFVHLDSYADGLKVGSNVLEGQMLGTTGETGSPGNPHLHIDAKNKDGEQINPEARNYGTVTNEKFFGEFGGDYKRLAKSESNASAKELKAMRATVEINGKQVESTRYDVSIQSPTTIMELLDYIMSTLMNNNGQNQNR